MERGGGRNAAHHEVFPPLAWRGHEQRPKAVRMAPPVETAAHPDSIPPHEHRFLRVVIKLHLHRDRIPISVCMTSVHPFTVHEQVAHSEISGMVGPALRMDQTGCVPGNRS